MDSINKENVTNKDFKNILRNIYMKEEKFITKLFSILPIPSSANKDESVDDDTIISEKHDKDEQINGQKTRAKSLTELRDRLKVMQKKKLSYTDRLLKKQLKNKIKKKNKREEILAQKKLARIAKKNKRIPITNIDNEMKLVVHTKENKPVFNKEGKIVFSKFELSDIGKESKKKTVKDPKKLLKTIEAENATIVELESKGETDKAKELKQKKAWKNALARAEGLKVKDDPLLLKKTIKRREQMKKSSKKKWENRNETVDKAKEKRLSKRNENIDQRIKQKKQKKIKKAMKQGRILLGK